MPELRILVALVAHIFATFSNASDIPGYSCCKDIGLKVPNKKCLMSWADFEEYGTNITWRSVYALKTNKNGQNAELATGWHISLQWDMMTNGTVRRRVAGWTRVGLICFQDAHFFGSGSCTGTAKVEALEGYSLSNVDRFVSSDPEKYIIYSFCEDDDVKCDGYCEVAYIGVLVKEPLPDTNGDGIPDGELLDQSSRDDIEEKLNECFDATMDPNKTSEYTMLEYAWQGQYNCQLGD